MQMADAIAVLFPRLRTDQSMRATGTGLWLAERREARPACDHHYALNLLFGGREGNSTQQHACHLSNAVSFWPVSVMSHFRGVWKYFEYNEPDEHSACVCC